MDSFVLKLAVSQGNATKPIGMLCEAITPELNALIEQISEITATINPVEVYTPVNGQKEKKKFIDAFNAGERYNPVFEYDQDLLIKTIGKRRPLLRLRTKLLKLESEDVERELLRRMVLARVEDALSTTRIAIGIFNRNDYMTAGNMRRKYGNVSKELHAEAMSLHKQAATQEQKTRPKAEFWTRRQIQKLEKKTYDALGIKSAFEYALVLYGFENDWTVVISDKVSAIDVRDKSQNERPSIYIPSHRTVSGVKLLELIGHEIECHVRQSMNGNSLLPHLGGGKLKTDDETFYEGLALMSDVDFSLKYLGDDTKKPKPYYTMAIKLAREGKDFYEVFRTIYWFRSAVEGEEKALGTSWSTCFRVFRGITETKTNRYKYACSKDKAYLEGYLYAEKMATIADTHRLLQSGVWSRSDLKVLAGYTAEVMYPRINVVAAVAGVLLSETK